MLALRMYRGNGAGIIIPARFYILDPLAERIVIISQSADDACSGVDVQALVTRMQGVVEIGVNPSCLHNAIRSTTERDTEQAAARPP
jgi:hypothetical protein